VNAPFTITVDPSNLLARKLSDLELTQVPFAAMQAINGTAFDVRTEWQERMPKVFDRPTVLTLNAILYTKATKQNLRAQVFVRDEAFKGNPPSKYLQAEVEGGQRRHKAFENRLTSVGILPAGMYVVPGKGAQLDAFGNISGGQITAILSQLGAHFDPLNNQTDTSRARRRKREAKQGSRAGDYFVPSKGSHLPPGVYQRLSTGFGGAVRSVLFFVGRATYRPRYPIYNFAQQVFDRRLAPRFHEELQKAVASRWSRAFG
jgi:hypothetical protein